MGIAGAANTHVLGKGRPKRNLTTRGRLGENIPFRKEPFDVYCRILHAYTIIYVNIGFFSLHFLSCCRLIADCGSVDAHNGEYIATWVNAGVLRVASGSVDGGLETVYTTPADTASLAISGETACIAYHPTAGAAGVIGEVQVRCRLSLTPPAFSLPSHCIFHCLLLTFHCVFTAVP